MKNMSVERLIGIIVEIIGIFVGAVKYDMILNEVGPAMFILGFMVLVVAIMVTVFPEAKGEDC